VRVALTVTGVTAMTAVSSPVTRKMEMTSQAAEGHCAEPHRPEDEAEGVWVHIS
jgi:hypothetical protein